jgi:hypothetical protein
MDNYGVNFIKKLKRISSLKSIRVIRILFDVLYPTDVLRFVIKIC